VDLGPTALGHLGQGQLLLSATASSVAAEPGVHFVRVTGTADPDLLLTVARDLTMVNVASNTLVTIPGAVP
jgi:hypothetical protein